MTRTRRRVFRRTNARPTIRPTALVVDADAQQRELIGILLAESGLDVIRASSSEEAVNALRECWHPDLATDEEDRRLREIRIKQINAAWDLISGKQMPA